MERAVLRRKRSITALSSRTARCSALTTAQTPWEAREEFPRFFAAQRARCGRLTLIANSIGAYFSLLSLDETLVDAAYLISPVVDMEKLIGRMMTWANVTEREHKD